METYTDMELVISALKFSWELADCKYPNAFNLMNDLIELKDSSLEDVLNNAEKLVKQIIVNCLTVQKYYSTDPEKRRLSDILHKKLEEQLAILEYES